MVTDLRSWLGTRGWNESSARALAHLEDIAFRIVRIANHEPGALPLLRQDLATQCLRGFPSGGKARDGTEELDGGAVARLRRARDDDLRRRLRRHGMNDQLQVG